MRDGLKRRFPEGQGPRAWLSREALRGTERDRRSMARAVQEGDRTVRAWARKGRLGPQGQKAACLDGRAGRNRPVQGATRRSRARGKTGATAGDSARGDAGCQKGADRAALAVNRPGRKGASGRRAGAPGDTSRRWERIVRGSKAGASSSETKGCGCLRHKPPKP